MDVDAIHYHVPTDRLDDPKNIAAYYPSIAPHTTCSILTTVALKMHTAVKRACVGRSSVGLH